MAKTNPFAGSKKFGSGSDDKQKQAAGKGAKGKPAAKKSFFGKK